MNRIKLIILSLIQLVVMQGISGQATTDLTDSIKRKFSDFVRAVPREEVYIHTDRQDYISGEDMWLNVYVVDRQSLKPSQYSSIVYFELLNSVNRPIIQKKISVHNGTGPGAIILPDTLTTGNYKIRAYTSWMRNFLPGNCFMKDIKIYNALNVKKIYSVKDALPAMNNEYSSGNDVKQKETGISLKINNSGKDLLEIAVEADNNFITESDRVFYVFIQTNGNINHASKEKITGSITKLSVPKSSLGKGINQVTIFDSKGKPVSVKYIYTPLTTRSEFSLAAPDSCGLRNKIRLGLTAADNSTGKSDSSQISISVSPATSGIESPGITDYMLFGSEYGQGLQNMDSLSTGSIDAILGSISSNWINWSVILSGKLPVLKYQMETNGPVILGKLISGDQKTVGSHEKVFLCFPGKEAEFQYSITDNDGNFSFYINSGEKHGDLILMPENNSDKRKIILRSSFSDIYPKSTGTIDSSSGFLDQVISKMSVNHQVQTIYATYAGKSQSDKISDHRKATRFYGKPDKELIMSDYISLPVMSEVFFELLPGVSMKKKQSGYEISLIEHVNDEINGMVPALMIDGVIIPDASMIANLDPELVEKIDIVKARYVVGKHIFSGIVNVITKAGDFTCVTLPDNMLRMPYTVTDPVMTFVSPDYSSEAIPDDRIPDYRNTLYWNPSVKIDKDGKVVTEFWSSDNKSDYLVNIQGITSDGKTFSIKKVVRIR
jgi:hypothetical protein